MLFLNAIDLGSRRVGSVLPVDVVSVHGDRPLKSDAGNFQRYMAVFIYLAGGRAVFCVAYLKPRSLLPNQAAFALRDPFPIKAGGRAPGDGLAAYPVRSIGPVNLIAIGGKGPADGIPGRCDQQKWTSQLSG